MLQEFNEICIDLQEKIHNRMIAHSRILQSGAGLFNVTNKVSRDDWRVFIQTQKINDQLPGIQGIGFSLLIPKTDLPHHLQQIRSEGFPSYNVKPAGNRELYSSIIYLEPFSGRNLRAFGYDMFSEPIRRQTMERARDSDNAALSGKVILVQETNKDIQAGTLMYVPVYRKGLPHDTLEQRRAAILGWVYSPYRMNDLMLGILGHQNLNEQKPLQLQIYDGSNTSRDHLLFDSTLGTTKTTPSHRIFNKLIPLDFNGTRWTLCITQTSKQPYPASYHNIWLTLFGGIFISWLIFALLRSLINTRKEALRIAENLTAHLREALTSSQRYRQALDQVHAYVYIKDNQFLYTYANRKTQELFSASEQEIIGKDDFQFFPLAAAQHVREVDTKVLTGEKLMDELVIDYPDGARKILLVVKTPLYSETDHNVVVGLMGISTDITERKKIEDELQKNQKLESLGLLAGGIAHDFNNLMNGIFGYIDLAKYSKELGQSQHYLNKAMSMIERARSLTTQLLTFATGGAPIQQLINLTPIIQETTRFALSGSNILCQFDITDALWFCSVDKNQISRVIENIVINARQASPGGGKIIVTATNTTLAEQENTALRPGNYIRISIQDNGVGMSKSILSRIFDPFFTTKNFGQGLGLATCYSIIKQHRGWIHAESEPEAGSTFFIYLPAVIDAPLQKHPPEKVALAQKGRILIMDDEEYIREIESRRLQRLGYQVIIAEEGDRALDLFKQAIETGMNFDLVILDLTIPGGKGGIEVLAEIRKLDTSVPVILSSGYNEGPEMTHPAQYGFSGALPKPYTHKELEACLGLIQP